jgi:hypothetical protein
MTLRILFWTVALGVAIVVAQTTDGEIAGRMNDKQGAPLPGVRITITNGDQSKAAITDSDGGFVLRSVTMGRYRVVAELAGFIPTSGEITLSSSSPRAFLAWPLEVGCLNEDIRVILDARTAAPLVDAILHIRVASADGPVLMSDRPECAGRVLQEYSVHVLGSAPGRGQTSPGRRQVFMSVRDARLDPGREYLALLWPEGYATNELVLPIVEGLVASPGAGELNGKRVHDALTILGNWARERRR